MTDVEPRRIEQSGKAALFAFLLFLGFSLAQLARHPPSTAHLVVVLGALVVFVALYLGLMLQPSFETSLRDYLGLTLMLAIAIALAFDNTAEWAPLFIYVAAVYGFRLRPPRAAAGIVACGALAAGAGAAGDYGTAKTISYAVWAVAIGFLLLSFQRLLHVVRELREARAEIARLAVTEERFRIARDLHDLLGHSLSVIALKSELARRLVRAESERVIEELAEIEQISRESLQEVRDAVTGYRRLTLAQELAGARVALTAAGIEPEIDGDAPALPPDVENVLAWAVREGTTNVIRHSGARRCAINVCADAATANVEIIDDGGGRDTDASGSGLAGLRERVARRRGRVEAGSRPEGGFRLQVTVPTS